MRLIPSLLCLLILAVSQQAAGAEFEIYQSSYKPLQLALEIDADPSLHVQSSQLGDVVQNDLASSQSFAAMNPLSFLDSASESWSHVDYGDWRLIGADVLALCHMTVTADGWQIQVQVHDPFRNKQLATASFTASRDDLRATSHRISDYIYQTVLGIPGYFGSHILYVRKLQNSSDLVYMDQDGANQQVVARNFTLLLSPDWSPDGKFAALNTYVGDRPRIELFDLQTGTRQTIANFSGLNSTPAFSPDGRYIAATLSYAGDPEIYIYDLQTQKWRAFTHNGGIDTSPTWSPDRKWIAFTSNRDGTPQIYRKSLETGEIDRVSLVGSYNTSPAWSPKGDRIAMVSLKNWEYAVATVRVDGSDIRYLATGKVESPAWSPNGQMLIYAEERQGIRQLYRIPSWGGHAEAITSVNEDASDPAWSR
ncbi:MAG TPA: Tol-Pal system beta propeller repeat protein TolB [Mariprofundaceae bacterium]|nr:Tol-Pal system beta propeller repeat protein TolB [Mariprofundaceae bacterium]